MTREQALEIVVKLANDVPLKGDDANLRIEALRIVSEVVQNAPVKRAATTQRP